MSQQIDKSYLNLVAKTSKKDTNKVLDNKGNSLVRLLSRYPDIKEV